MKTFNVTITQVSKARPDYYNLLIDGNPMAEMKYVPGYVYGFYPVTNMAEAVYNQAARIVSSHFYDDRGVIGCDFRLQVSDPLVSEPLVYGELDQLAEQHFTNWQE